MRRNQPMRSQALHGRTGEIAALDRALERVRGGAPTLVTIAGEPGIGKTTLLERLERRAEQTALPVLRAEGAEFERGVPFGAIAEALDDHLSRLDPARLGPLPAADRDRLAALLPVLAAGSLRTPPTGDERHLTLRALRSLLELLAARRPLVLALDDLQWMDAATRSSWSPTSPADRRTPRSFSRSPSAPRASSTPWAPPALPFSSGRPTSRSRRGRSP